MENQRIDVNVEEFLEKEFRSLTLEELQMYKEKVSQYCNEQGVKPTRVREVFYKIINSHIEAKQAVAALYMQENKKIPTAQVAQKGL